MVKKKNSLHSVLVGAAAGVILVISSYRIIKSEKKSNDICGYPLSIGLTALLTVTTGYRFVKYHSKFSFY